MPEQRERPTEALRKRWDEALREFDLRFDGKANSSATAIYKMNEEFDTLDTAIRERDARIAELEELFPLMGCGSRAIPGTQHWIWLEARAMCRSNDVRWSDLEDADKDWSCVFSTQEACENAYKKSRKETPHA